MMWIRKRKWEALVERVETMEKVLLRVEFGSHMFVPREGEQARATTCGYGRILLDLTSTANYSSAVELIHYLLQKLGLRATRSTSGALLITEIPKAEGGTTGRAKDGRFTKKG